ncbi:MAG: PDZ domain-containing protein [Cytophagales bacterium]|nr:MAG: PDZ domain-containing protein [Cytophagales bacterium]
MKNIKLWIPTFLLSFTAGILGAMAWQWGQMSFLSTQQNPQFLPEYKQYARSTSQTAALGTNSDFVKASALSTRSVVYIKTVSEQRTYDIFEYYFGGGGSGKTLGSGSGVIMTADGYIVTNYHVIEDAEQIEVVHEKRTYAAKVVGTDPSSDLAILKIEGKGLPMIKLGTSRDLQVGEWVIAVGNPFNLESTVTAGIVSAKGRSINLLGGKFPLESFIQTDAAINPGNSGGALVNMNGELVGINTAILSRTGYYTGYGFAVPVDIVAKVVNDLIQYGNVQKAFMGTEVEDLNSTLEKKYNLQMNSLQGAVVTILQSNGAGAKAGLQVGDVIVRINNDTVNSKSNFEEQLSYYRPGDKIKVGFLRNGNFSEVSVTLENINGSMDIVKDETVTIPSLGASFEVLSQIEKERLGVKSGVRLVKLWNGLISRLGLEPGFIITAINGQPVTTPQDVETLINKTRGKLIIEGINKNGAKGYYQFYY